MTYNSLSKDKEGSKTPRNTVKILGVSINSSPPDQLLKEILALLDNQSSSTDQFSLNQPRIIFTPNPEFLVAATRQPEFRQILSQADINWPESFGLVLASWVLNRPLQGRMAGATLVERLLEEGDRQKWRVGIAGARRGVKSEVDQLRQKLKEKYPNLEFYCLDNQSAKIKKLKFKIVFACHGMMKQERWILENKERIKADVFVGVGGSLDFLTGFAKRAPIWVQKAGLEWLWRGFTKPGHWKRIYTAVIVFPLLVLKEALQENFKIKNLKLKI